MLQKKNKGQKRRNTLEIANIISELDKNSSCKHENMDDKCNWLVRKYIITKQDNTKRKKILLQ